MILIVSVVILMASERNLGDEDASREHQRVRQEHEARQLSALLERNYDPLHTLLVQKLFFGKLRSLGVLIPWANDLGAPICHTQRNTRLCFAACALVAAGWHGNAISNVSVHPSTSV